MGGTEKASRLLGGVLFFRTVFFEEDPGDAGDGSAGGAGEKAGELQAEFRRGGPDIQRSQGFFIFLLLFFSEKDA